MAPRLVSRRPVRGEDSETAGFYRVAAATEPSYPIRPVRIIVPFVPGGPTDIQARWAGQQLNAALGQAFIIDNYRRQRIHDSSILSSNGIRMLIVNP